MRGADRHSRFMFEDFPVRGELVKLGATWRAVLERQIYPPAVRDLLGEALSASVLLASTLKFEGMLTMQIQGDGDMHLLVAQCTSDLNVRGLAKWKGEDPRGTLAELTGGGRLAITVETGRDGDRYQGIVAADTDSLAACLENYFARSEQLPSRLWLAADGQHAGGLLLQQLPARAEQGEGDPDGWNRTQMLAGTLSPDELLGLGRRQMLQRLFHGEDLRLGDARPVTFRCSCTRGRVESALRLLGRGELEDLLREEGRIEVRCEFCNKAYDVDAVDVERLLSDPGAVPPAPSRSLH